MKAGDIAAFRLDRPGFDPVHELRREPVRLSTIKYAIDLSGDVRLVRFAKSRRRFDQRLQQGSQIEGRAADHLEHVGGRRLLLQRLGQIARASLHFVK